MKERLKLDFEKTIKFSDFSENDIKFKNNSLEKFIKKGFPSRKLERIGSFWILVKL